MKKATLTLILSFVFYQVVLCQCHPAVSNSGVTDDYIKEFSFGVNIKQNIQDYVGDYYVDSMTSAYTSGVTYPFTVQTGSSTLAQDIAIWADWNLDGDFVDVGEAVYNSSSSIVSTTILNGNINIPAIADGYYTLRLASIRNGATSANTCNINGYGQFEDIRIAIGIPTLCAGIPSAGNAILNYALNGSILTNTLFLNGASYNSNLLYQWQRSNTGIGPWIYISGGSSPFINNATPFTSTTCYRCIVTCTTTGMKDTSNTTCALGFTSCSPLNLGNTLTSATTICSGNAINLSMQFPPTAASLVTYQWHNSNGPVLGATNATYYYITSATDTFYCQVTCSINGYTTSSTPVAVVVANMPSSASSTDTACNTYTWNTTTYTNTGMYTQTLVNAIGCDSVHTLDLTIFQSTDSTITSIDCDYYLAGGTLYTSTGVYTQTFANATGCDSVMHYNLTINQSTDSLVNAVSCNLFSLNGQTYTTTGIYTQSYTNAAGCDSALTLQVSVDTLNATITINSVTISTPNVGTYQWIECSTMMPIIGATNLNFTPTVSSDYAIEVTAGACVDTSICVPIWMTGINHLATESMSVFPNPSLGIFDLFLPDDAEIKISNALGKIIIENKLNNGKHIIDLSNYAAGIYFIRTLQANKLRTTKVLISPN